MLNVLIYDRGSKFRVFHVDDETQKRTEVTRNYRLGDISVVDHKDGQRVTGFFFGEAVGQAAEVDEVEAVSEGSHVSGNRFFGVDFAALIAETIAPSLLPCTLAKRTVGTRTGGSLNAGTNPQSTSYDCMGFIASGPIFQVRPGLEQATLFKAVVVGNTIAGGAVIPVPGDQFRVTNTDGTYSPVYEITSVDADPANAVYGLVLKMKALSVHKDEWKIGRYRHILVAREEKQGLHGRYFFWFYCPACWTLHAFVWPDWDFNGNFEKPTFSPKLTANPSCSLFLQDGLLTYTGKSKHHLAGRVARLPLLDESYGASRA